MSAFFWNSIWREATSKWSVSGIEMGLWRITIDVYKRQLQKVAGSKMRSILEVFTKNRVIGLLVGIFFTALIQSCLLYTSQVTFMKDFEQQGGISFLLLYFTARDEYYYLRYETCLLYTSRCV